MDLSTDDHVVDGRRMHNAAGPGTGRLSASMGMHTADGAGVDDLLREADRRMYEMKRSRSLREGQG